MRLRGRPGAMGLFGAIVPPGAAAAANHPEIPRSASAALLEREPMGFDGGTLQRITDGFRALPDRLPDLARTFGEHSRALGFAGSALLLLLLVAIGYALVGRHRLAERFERALGPLRRRLSPRAAPWLSALAQTLAAALLPFSLWAVHALCVGLLDTRDPLFLLFAPLLVAWTVFTIGAVLLGETLLRPLLPVPREHGLYLYQGGRRLLFFGVVASVLVETARVLGAPADVVALARATVELSLILFVAVYLSHRRAVMALFPDLPNRLYQRFVAGLDRLYFLALGVALVTALLAWAGYVRLAHFVWLRTWTLVALFLVAVFVHHALRVSLRLWILEEHAPRESAQSFFRSAARLLDYVTVIVVVLLAVEISGVRAPLARLLAAPFSTVGGRTLSVLTIVQGGVIVATFVFAAQLVRDYLEDRIYPALAIDEGVAHAIDTSIVYSLSAIGVLAALEAVGLGLGSITVFAGALGIGIGFGLQTLASNLASGIVLIFSRALRKGDWVKVGDTVGVIQEVGIRATRLRSEDAIEYLVPNSEFVAGTIVNWTHSSPYVRVHVPVGVSYKSNPDEVREILERVASQTPHVERAPRPEVRFTKFADSSLDFELLVWIHRKQISEDEVTSALYFAIFSAFAEAGIEIPFPQRDLHIR